jgi:hypothetical protein
MGPGRRVTGAELGRGRVSRRVKERAGGALRMLARNPAVVVVIAVAAYFMVRKPSS